MTFCFLCISQLQEISVGKEMKYQMVLGNFLRNIIVWHWRKWNKTVCSDSINLYWIVRSEDTFWFLNINSFFSDEPISNKTPNYLNIELKQKLVNERWGCTFTYTAVVVNRYVGRWSVFTSIETGGRVQSLRCTCYLFSSEALNLC